jgi:arsenite methyltransferase
MLDIERIKRQVRARYSVIAQGGVECCEGGSGFAVSSPLYPESQIRKVAEGAVSASAGCGNPNAMGDLRQGETVVDLGSGGGLDCFIAAGIVGNSGAVIGVDMTPAMIALAQKNKTTMRADNVEFRLADIEDTGIPSDSVDVVISNCVITLVPDKSRVFQEAYRILRDGGRMRISDVLLNQPLPEEAASSLAEWTHCISGVEHVERYLGMIKEAGFNHAEILSQTPYAWHTDEPWISCVSSMDILAVK